MNRRLFGSVALVTLLFAQPGPAAGENVRTYEVTISNMTDAQWFTPAVVVTHRGAVDLFTVGRPASFEVKEVAENGNIGPLVDLASSNRHVWDTQVVLGTSGPPPIAPGTSVTFEISSADGAIFLSWVSMLICTNDGFTGLDSVLLPVRIGETVTFDTVGYDAGTEVNTEAWEDLVPPCAMLTGFGDQGGTGMSNPALAEDGVIHKHDGISGTADLDADIHGWSNPVASVEVTRSR